MFHKKKAAQCCDEFVYKLRVVAREEVRMNVLLYDLLMEVDICTVRQSRFRKWDYVCKI